MSGLSLPRGWGAAAVAVPMVAVILSAGAARGTADDGPRLVGTWSGKTNSIGDIYGLRTRDRTVHITEQTDRRFRGYFVYEAGRKYIFGIVFPDDKSFAWVSTTSKGYVEGRILASDRIAACYIEPGPEATAGCSDLTRTDPNP